MRFSELSAGDAFPSASFTLDANNVALYLAATEDDNALYWSDGAVQLVPPLAVAALAFRDIAERVVLQPGSLHTGQELAFSRAIRAEETLTTRAAVAASSQRRGFTALVVELAAHDASAAPVLSGRMTLMVAPPAEGAADAGIMGAPSAGAQRRDAAQPPTVAYAPLAPEAVAAGVQFEPVTRTVSQRQIDLYAAASGDYNPIHVDPAFAATTPFGGTVAHGMLLLSYLSSQLTRAFGRRYLDGGSLKVKFRNPGPAGIVATARGQIERVEPDAHGVQYAVCAVRLENDSGEPLITGEARVPACDQ